MKLPSRSKFGAWDADELEVLSLLLQGDAWYLPKLRSQIQPPFCHGVHRLLCDNRCICHIQYDPSAVQEFSLGADAWFGLPCLVVKDNRFERPLVFHSGVSDGVLTGLSGFHPLASDWPKVVKIHDWCYIDFPWNWQSADFSTKAWMSDVPLLKPLPMPPGWPPRRP